MSKTFELDIITPINTSSFMDVEYLRAPSIEGLFGVLPGHISSIIALDIGEIKIIQSKETLRFSTSGGFADIKKDKVILVLETAEESDKISFLGSMLTVTGVIPPISPSIFNFSLTSGYNLNDLAFLYFTSLLLT